MEKLIWLDLEMTGLNPDKDLILEIATVITDNELNVIEEGPSLVIHQPDLVLNSLDEWNTIQHTKSGLIDESRNSNITLEDAGDQTLDFLKKYCKKNESPLCGNTIWNDKRFLYKHIQNLNNFVHYRVIDVSSIKEVVQRWYQNSPKANFRKKDLHRALSDIYESIEELKYYKNNFFKDKNE